MKHILFFGFMLLSGCAALQTNIVKSNIPPTIFIVDKPTDSLRRTISRATAEWNWNLEKEDMDAGVISYKDPVARPGWLNGYFVRYTFFLEPKDSGTRLRIKATALEVNEYGTVTNEGPTDALKALEMNVAKRLQAYE